MKRADRGPCSTLYTTWQGNKDYNDKDKSTDRRRGEFHRELACQRVTRVPTERELYVREKEILSLYRSVILGN